MEEQEEGRSLMDKNNLGQQFDGETGLTDRDKAILDFEEPYGGMHNGHKENEIVEKFDMRPTRYYQILNTLIHTTGALDYKPMLVKKLRHIKNVRNDKRSASRAGLKDDVRESKQE